MIGFNEVLAAQERLSERMTASKEYDGNVERQKC